MKVLPFCKHTSDWEFDYEFKTVTCELCKVKIHPFDMLVWVKDFGTLEVPWTDEANNALIKIMAGEL